MSTEIIYNIPEFIAWLWVWCGLQDGRVSFGLGVLTWIIISRIFSSFQSPISAVIAVLSVLIVLIIALSAWVGLSGMVDMGEETLRRVTDPSNANTFNEVSK